MISQQVSSNFQPDRAAQVGLSLFQTLFKGYHPRDFGVRFWDGSTWDAEPGQPTKFTVVVKHPGALLRMFWLPNNLKLGEAYIFDDFDIEGDMGGIFALRDYLVNAPFGFNRWLHCARLLLTIPHKGRRRSAEFRAINLDGVSHSKERDRQAVTYHYDLSNEFFKLWLDRQMIYSCGYFKSRDDDLDRAQENKLDYICRKLRLRSGERLLDIGCGWGGLVMHAARHYGARVLGITLSARQAELANERIRRAGLADVCRVEIRDYRDVEENGSYDKIVSVGMFEHVGESQLLNYIGRAWRLLKPGGVFLNHGIARAMAESKRKRLSFTKNVSFIDAYVFPDYELLPISTTLRAAEMSGFEVRDVESLREHYALTLQHWVRRLEARKNEIKRIVNDVTYRVWRLYMAGSAYSFQTGELNLYQVLLAKSNRGNSGLPMTRDDWYLSGTGPASPV